MAGYYKNDEANRKVFDSERFFNTQDLGFVDRRGHIHITGRKKNVIILDSGKNVYPEELELYFSSSPLIAEIAVFGRKIEGRETVYAVIVPATKGAGSYGAVREVVGTLNHNLPAYKALNNFALSAYPLPRNSTRKVLIDEVTRLLHQGAFQADESGTVIPRNILTPTGIREEEIIGILGKKLHTTIIRANETLSDHQIDSLGLIELIVYLEDVLGIVVDVEKVNPLMTMEEFVRHLASCPQHSGANLDELILRSPVTTKTRTFPNPLSELVVFLVQALSRLFWDLQIINKKFLIPENSIIAANHQSYLDLPWIIGAIPYRLRNHVFSTGKKELSFLRYPFMGSPILFVDRKGNVAPSLKAAADILRSGDSLVIFPEGTRSNDGKLGKFKSGAAYLAYHLDKKIIPVTIKGAFEIMPRNTIIPRFFSKAQGRIIVGEAIDPHGFTSVDALNEHLHSLILKQKESRV
jgi:long-chain acyl-CoA synthetase